MTVNYYYILRYGSRIRAKQTRKTEKELQRVLKVIDMYPIKYELISVDREEVRV